MKVLLYILLGLQILAGVFIFFIYATSFWYIGLILLLVTLLQATLTITVIDNKNRIENLEYHNNNIFSKLRNIENENIDSHTVPAVNQNKNVAIGTWECIKCGTVNKVGTSSCANCKADYIPEINPTVNPNDKKKRVSRWIKYK